MYDCEICGVKMNGEVIREAHLKGAKHYKKVKAAELVSIADQDPAIVKTDGNNLFSCSICDVILNSQFQLKAHLDGSKHQAKAGQAGIPKKTTESGLQMASISISAEPIAASSSSGVSGDSSLYCEKCDVQANSTAQFEQHITSQKHLTKLRGPAPQAVLNKKFKSQPHPFRPQQNPNFFNNPGIGYRGPRFNSYAAGYNSFQNHRGGYSRGRGGFHNGYNNVRFPNHGYRDNLPPMETFFPPSNGVAM